MRSFWSVGLGAVAAVALANSGCSTVTPINPPSDAGVDSGTPPATDSGVPPADAGAPVAGARDAGGLAGPGYGTEYHPCQSDTDCQSGQKCVGGASGKACLIPCSTQGDCHNYEICKDGAFCFVNLCRPPQPPNSQPSSYYGSCTASDGDAGICLPYSDPTGGGLTIGICFLAGTVAPGGACAVNWAQDWSVARSQSCAPPDLCVPGPQNGTAGSCGQGCDPTGTLASAPACPSGSCTQVPTYADPYLGLCNN